MGSLTSSEYCARMSADLRINAEHLSNLKFKADSDKDQRRNAWAGILRAAANIYDAISNEIEQGKP